MARPPSVPKRSRSKSKSWPPHHRRFISSRRFICRKRRRGVWLSGSVEDLREEGESGRVGEGEILDHPLAPSPPPPLIRILSRRTPGFAGRVFIICLAVS